jgi:hypothetical protein
LYDISRVVAVTKPAATATGGITVMLHTFVRVTVRCDTPGCHSQAERVLQNGEPRALLAAVRRSLRRRDGWALTTKSRWIGPYRDMCPACQAPKLPAIGPRPAADPAQTPVAAAAEETMVLRPVALTDSAGPARDIDVIPANVTVAVVCAPRSAPPAALEPEDELGDDDRDWTGASVPDTIPEHLLAPRQ